MVETQGLTLLTMMRPRWSRARKHFMLKWFLAYAAPHEAFRRLRGRERQLAGAPRFIEALNFIHYGRWIVLSCHPYRRRTAVGLPKLNDADQPDESLPNGLMLFTSNFDHDWRPYVDTFMEAAGPELGVFWDTMPDWVPFERLGNEKFFAFVNEHAIDNDHYYAAYPRLTTRNLKSALAVDRAIRSFDRTTNPPNGQRSSNEVWGTQFLRLVAKLQGNLMKIPETASMKAPYIRYAEGGFKNVAITSVAPFPRTSIEAVRAAIAAMPTQPARQATSTPSPFGDVCGTHFARLTIIDDVADTSGAMPVRWKLESAYLLLSADTDGFEGGAQEWLGHLYDNWSTSGRIDSIWGECYEYRNGSKDRDAFIDLIMKTSFNPTLGFADYPRTTLWDIERSLRSHEMFTNFLFAIPTADLHDGASQLAQSHRADFEAIMRSQLKTIDPPGSQTCR